MCIVTELCHHLAKRYPKKFVIIGHPISVILVLVATPFFFTLQMFYIAPKIFNDVLYKFYWVVAIFITHNILGNMLFCYLYNSSVERLPKEGNLPVPEEKHLWHYCEICQKLMPPRSWHCALCGCCILKRDHHCLFTASCVGHNNHRYFFWFTFYMTLGTFLSLITSLVYGIMSGISIPFYDMFYLLMKDTSPTSCSYCQYIILLLNNVACAVPALMLAFQIQIVCLNATYYQIFDRTYDLGFRKNCKLIMGQRGLWTFLSPTLKSPLLHDGKQWQMRPESKLINAPKDNVN
ncbi:probable palmitoyltransferase ZDHHC24 [Drosophila elegans]|uniref:probable palmitoyltransferase ZDHHC24 n=1 Tax=Drosophila elegans TaxID=30023 RepID=UPI0007E63DE1|nr:probable palmitoyltransferase ZDHHC24 [Drosophila elegans]